MDVKIAQDDLFCQFCCEKFHEVGKLGHKRFERNSVSASRRSPVNE